ncbi:MAG: guanylate kinase [bacterium]
MLIKKGKLFVFSAPSGAGKTTIVRDVLKSFPELVFSISATTRKKRENEIEGVHYFFISEEEFKKKIEADEFVEWERFYDYYYGTLKCFIDENISNGKSVVFEVDVKGGVSIKEKYNEAVTIYIMPPGIEALKERLINRKTENEEDFGKRIKRAEMELSYKDKFDHVIVNEDLETAKKEVKELVNKLIKE